MLWQNISYKDIVGCLEKSNGTAMLPVGATEQHGPHLGCGVDSVIVSKLCESVSDITGVPVLPLIPYGCSIGHSKKWPSTIAVSPVVLIEFITEIGRWAYFSGVRRLFIINGHVTNNAPLRCALEILRSEFDDYMIGLIDTSRISQRVNDMHIKDGDDWHANDAETSIILKIADELVSHSLIDSSDDQDRTIDKVFSHPVNKTSINGVTGKPSAATREKGEELFDWMICDLAKIIRKGMTESPPLQG
ncbi:MULTISPECIES: creatininase family protein [Acidithiobacillus]|uniref:creatininase family protein n=1 Tax=Acidithiobacillus TaxID=119977 RepID=UPI00094AFFFD|nr:MULTISPECIES: creatininase family protein [Acidithiobacillus]MBE7564401.1 creatininase family protein [Acidithiobacillus sp. HP-6]MBE7571038.1 creatininase family protein [Acidithiobacillus sp. HP-2]